MRNIKREKRPVAIDISNSWEVIAAYPDIIPKKITESRENICDISD